MLLCNYWWFCSTPAKQVLKHDPVFALSALKVERVTDVLLCFNIL
jgi:hypothetical protein